MPYKDRHDTNKNVLFNIFLNRLKNVHKQTNYINIKPANSVSSCLYSYRKIQNKSLFSDIFFKWNSVIFYVT